MSFSPRTPALGLLASLSSDLLVMFTHWPVVTGLSLGKQAAPLSPPSMSPELSDKSTTTFSSCIKSQILSCVALLYTLLKYEPPDFVFPASSQCLMGKYLFTLHRVPFMSLNL